MVSSPGGGGGSPPQTQTPGGTIMPQGQSMPYQPNWISFLGDTNTPSTGLTPDMLARINASNGPPPGAMAAPSGLTSGDAINLRNQLAALTAARSGQNQRQAMQQQQQQLGLGRNGSAGGF